MTVIEETSGWYRFIGPEYCMQCPYCEYENYLPEWRFNWFKDYRDEPEVIQDMIMYNPDMELDHAFLHVPQSY